jgi:hypothetical protein
MLIEIAAGTLEALAVAPVLWVRRIGVNLPIELALRRVGDQVQLVGDLPRSVTRTAFDVRPGRLEVVWEIKERL